MNEIGEALKEKREEIGITAAEVASDLNTDSILIENLESGNHKVFKDILELKEIISSYAKYLGLDAEELLDKLNDYLFETTSKISIDDIKERLKNDKQDNKKRIKSPYTLESVKKNNYTGIAIAFLIIVILVIFYVILKQVFF